MVFLFKKIDHMKVWKSQQLPDVVIRDMMRIAKKVNSMIKILLGKKPVNDDSSDALAIAITANNHEAYEENSGNSSKYNLNRAIQKALQNQR